MLLLVVALAVVPANARNFVIASSILRVGVGRLRRAQRATFAPRISAVVPACGVAATPNHSLQVMRQKRRTPELGIR